ncbi:MAG TPA: TraR/DksA family transcriptional regulator [Candidatus Treponema faecavium]|nr:TraR/DksA family transcriptional regulator [Candidatus Treponema faecavium]
MDQSFIAEMEQALQNERTELLSSLSTNNVAFKQSMETMDPGDSIDEAADAIDRKMLDAMSAKDMNKLNLIDNALARIKQGTYGLCMKCGKMIPEQRLRAIPYAVLCIACKSADERKSRS